MTLISSTTLSSREGFSPLSARKPGRAYVPLRLFPNDPSASAERVNGLMQTARRGFETSSLLKTSYRQIPSQPKKPQIKNALAAAVRTKDWRKAALFNTARKGLKHLREGTLPEPEIDQACAQAAHQGDWVRFKLMMAARRGSSASWALSNPISPDFTEKELEAACFEAVLNGNWKFILDLAGKDLLTNRILIKMLHTAHCRQVKGVKKPLMKYLLPKDADKSAREDVLFESIAVGCPLTAKYALEHGEFSIEALENSVLACCENDACGEKELKSILAYILRKTQGFLFTEARSNALLSAAERGRTSLIDALLGSDAPERAMRCREAVYVAAQQQNSYIGAFFNSAEPQYEILSTLLAWCKEKKNTEEYPSRLLAASKIVKCERERSGELRLNGLGLTSLPNCLHLLEKLEKLDLSRNSLARLPLQFMSCANLRTLNISGNPLQRLPEDLVNLNPDCVVIAPLPLESQTPPRLPNGSRPTFLYAAEPAKKRVPTQSAKLPPPVKSSRLADGE